MHYRRRSTNLLARLFAPFAASAIAGWLLAGCASLPPGPTAQPSSTATVPPAIVHASAVRDAAPEVPTEDLAALVEGHRAFAVDLYHALASSSDHNLVFSPYSISIALSMLYGGARHATADQMATTLHFSLPHDHLHAAANALDQALTSRGDSGDPANPYLQLNIANGVWAEQTYTFHPDYLDLLGRNYGAGVRMADFTGAPEASRQVINQWVSDQTKDKIKDLFPTDAINSDTRMVLANAIYFNATWATTFDPNDTHSADFTRLDNSIVSVPMMTESVTAGYSSGQGYQAAVLPYKGGQDRLAMLLVLPDKGTYPAFEKDFTTAQLKKILSSLTQQEIQVDLPSFDFGSSFSLADQLAALGMPDAFDPGKADFSGMADVAPGSNLYVGLVVHKAVISVKESGTEAAAATGVTVQLEAAMQPPATRFVADHPFLFAIFDVSTGDILFLGRVLNPQS